MEPNQILSLRTTTTDPEHLKVIQWEDFQNDLARLASLSSALGESKEKKRDLHRKLESLIQANGESLGRLNELEEMHQRLESKKVMMENMSIRSRLAKENASKQEEQLSGAVQSLLVAGGGLSVCRRNLQVSLILSYSSQYNVLLEIITINKFSSLYEFFCLFLLVMLMSLSVKGRYIWIELF
ncbi:uncharacterized protein LOC124838106 [Vigna umbellata]|uniref:uncharacterized protein LOC124838106 n=1 Tax=Vigna umbellata TaxID=87088 RepID=UPI001F5EDD46|nr:uncharacterized protein LOC124838106 [Vigna umbellata]